MKSVSPEITTMSDHDLILAYKADGDYNYVGELYTRYTSFVFAVSMKYLKDTELASDAVMDVFEKLLVDLKRFQIDSFKKWLHTVVKNHCLLNIRSQGYKRRFEDNYKKDQRIFMENDPHMHHQNEKDKETDLVMLKEAMESLKKEQKTCVQLFYLEEKCYQEVSDITGYSMKQVKSFIQNGKRNLKILLEEMRKHSSQGEVILVLILLIIL